MNEVPANERFHDDPSEISRVEADVRARLARAVLRAAADDDGCPLPEIVGRPRSGRHEPPPASSVSRRGLEDGVSDCSDHCALTPGGTCWAHIPALKNPTRDQAIFAGLEPHPLTVRAVKKAAAEIPIWLRPNTLVDLEESA